MYKLPILFMIDVKLTKHYDRYFTTGLHYILFVKQNYDFFCGELEKVWFWSPTIILFIYI